MSLQFYKLKLNRSALFFIYDYTRKNKAVSSILNDFNNDNIRVFLIFCKVLFIKVN